MYWFLLAFFFFYSNYLVKMYKALKMADPASKEGIKRTIDHSAETMPLVFRIGTTKSDVEMRA